MPNVQYISTKPVSKIAHVIELAEVGSIFFFSFFGGPLFIFFLKSFFLVKTRIFF